MQPITSPHRDRSVLAPRLRRLQLALDDLGIARIVGDGWVVVGDTGFEFGALHDDTTDRLVRHVEDLARLHAASLPGDLAGGDGRHGDAVAAPVAPPRRPSTIHLVVPQ